MGVQHEEVLIPKLKSGKSDQIHELVVQARRVAQLTDLTAAIINEH